MSDGFFSRWSRRKQEAAAVSEVSESVAPAETSNAALPQPDLRPQEPLQATAPLPTLDDALALTPESDFQPFMQHDVSSAVRNIAMKKLFSDPHFNVMDGLDIYIDDYSRSDPIPAGMLRRMASTQFLKLIPEGLGAPSTPEQGHDAHEAITPTSPLSGAQSPFPAPINAAPQHDHPDLQLQPNPASGDPQPEPGTR